MTERDNEERRFFHHTIPCSLQNFDKQTIPNHSHSYKIKRERKNKKERKKRERKEKERFH
jgi:hypothetical protein